MYWQNTISHFCKYCLLTLLSHRSDDINHAIILSVDWWGYHENFSSTKEMKSTASIGTDATIFFAQIGTMQFATVSSCAQRFFKSVTMTTQGGT